MEVEDLRHGQPSCYLVSGYRGAGKTTFVKDTEKQIAEQTIEESPEIVFVYLNFSRALDPKFT